MKKWMQVFFLVWFLFVGQVSKVTAQEPVIRILLFYSPACGHCHRLISDDLPPLINPYIGEPDYLNIPPTEAEESVGPSLFGLFGDSVEILYVNTLTEVGNGLYRALVTKLSIPSELQAVPTMVVGGNLLVGGGEIPEKLPGIIEEGLANNGIDWIDLPGLADAIDQLVEATAEPTPTEEPAQEATEEFTPTAGSLTSTATPIPTDAVATEEDPTIISTEDPTDSLFETRFSVLDRIKMDLVGNSIAIVILIAMVVVTALVASRAIFPEISDENLSLSWLIPLFAVIGIAVAAYLTYVEASGTEAVCGPVGDCNTVQSSKYAFLFGVFPVGLIGLLGYVGIILAWLVARFANDPTTHLAKVALLGMSLIGTLFSIYLTFLEPFVIGATCAWCVTSAILITAIMWLSEKPGTDALARVMEKPEELAP
jgi:uncharacterized membrane protein